MGVFNNTAHLCSTFTGDYLITKQTTAEGRICNSVMITERKYTRKEYYLAFMNERAFSVSYFLPNSTTEGVGYRNLPRKLTVSIVCSLINFLPKYF